MSILFINGSPNKKGNTVALAERLLKNRDYETLHLVDYKVYSYGQKFEDDAFDVILEQMKAGKQVILEIDVQGGFQIREKMPEAHLVFIEPPSMEELEKRLRGRGTEDDETIARRLKAAELELSRKEEYDIRLVNDNLDEAARKLAAYVDEQAELARE